VPQRAECVDCHGGTCGPFDYPSDYVSLHGSDAAENTPDSRRATAQVSSAWVHQRAGVAARTGGVPGVQARNLSAPAPQLKSFHPRG